MGLRVMIPRCAIEASDKAQASGSSDSEVGYSSPVLSSTKDGRPPVGWSKGPSSSVPFKSAPRVQAALDEGSTPALDEGSSLDSPRLPSNCWRPRLPEGEPPSERPPLSRRKKRALLVADDAETSRSSYSASALGALHGNSESIQGLADLAVAHASPARGVARSLDELPRPHRVARSLDELPRPPRVRPERSHHASSGTLFHRSSGNLGVLHHSGNLSQSLSDGEGSCASALSQSDCDSDSDEELPEHEPLSCLQLHALHCLKNLSVDSLSNKRHAPKPPVSLPGCKTPAQLVVAAAQDSTLKLKPPKVKCAILQGQLLVAAEDFTIGVPLIGSLLENAPGTVVEDEDTMVMAIVPPAGPAAAVEPSKAATGKGGKDEEAARPAPDARAYLLCCPQERWTIIQEMLLANGCYRTGLKEHWQTDRDETSMPGSFGLVVCARPRGNPGGAQVAVKLIKTLESEEQVRVEVEMLVLAQGHPNIVKFKATYIDVALQAIGFKWALVFDYYSGGDMHEQVSKGPRMWERDAMPIMRQLLLALDHLHARDIFHRDVKPENMLRANSSRVVLTDFGIACLVTDEKEMLKSSGTIGYASPEMLHGAAKSFDGDAFGAGVVLFFMLSRSTPFVAPTCKLISEKTLTCEVSLKYAVFEHLSDGCRNIILGLLQKSVNDRLTIPEALRMEAALHKFTATDSVLPPLRGVQQARRQGDGYAAMSSGALPPLQRVPNQPR